MNTNYKSIILTIGLFLAFSVSVPAAPGDLDTTFGSGGIVVTRGNSFNHLNTGNAMAIQADGKIVVVGEGATSNTFDFAVVRYNTDGSLDTSFGGTGIVITPVGDSFDQAFSVAIQADGKIVVAGSSGIIFALVRYNTDGTLDTSFNGTGKVITGESYAKDLAIQTDGKIVAVGGEIALRFNTDGSPDTSFGGTGRIFLGIEVNSVAIQADGKIVAAGRLQNSFAIARHNPDGSPDTSFNGTGKVITPVGNSGSRANELAIQADGKIVAAGSTGDSDYSSNADFALVRYHPNGSLDTTFGGIGKIIIPIGNYGDSTFSVAIQSNGKIVAAGYSYYGSDNVITHSDFVVVRLNPNGSLDTTFGGTGKVITSVPGNWDGARSVAVQSDGRIVVAGSSDPDLADFYDFVVIRYQGGSNANIRTRFDFDGDGKADIAVFRPSDRTWYLNRSTQGFTAIQWGLANDKLAPADYDGDGKTDISVYRDGTWYWLASSNNHSFNARQFGIASDVPVPADYTGDGRAELAIYRSGSWWIQDLTNNQTQVVNFGLATDKPVPADFDGDGRIDQAVYRNGEWHLNRSSQGYAVANFGLATDKPVVGDYDGDGRADEAVYRDGVWYVLRSTQGFAAFPFGLSTDIPAPADYDGDGKTDAAVFRDGVWYLLQSTNGISIQQFGLIDDKPVPSAYLP
jgi:uncharacterized delta-60 repeat protein